VGSSAAVSLRSRLSKRTPDYSHVVVPEESDSISNRIRTAIREGWTITKVAPLLQIPVPETRMDIAFLFVRGMEPFLTYFLWAYDFPASTSPRSRFYLWNFDLGWDGLCSHTSMREGYASLKHHLPPDRQDLQDRTHWQQLLI
jgi:hypothetical protein